MVFQTVRRRRPLVVAAALLSLMALLAGCGSKPQEAAARGNEASGGAVINLNGAGATFPYPIYSKWFDEYSKSNPVKVNYQSIGSGGGQRQITERTVDFGASDAPMTDEALAKAPGELLHIPTVLGAVVVTYNIPGVNVPLKMTPDVVADLFLGKITKWNDQRLTELNPDVKLPDLPVAVVHRSDGSGTTAVFTDYLSKISPEWKEKVGTGTSVKWPTGIGAKGNEGVSGQVAQTRGAVGYVELAYAIQNKMPYAHLKNKAGEFVEPSVETTSAAAAGAAANMPADLRVSITNADGEKSYPIASFTYILAYKEQADKAKGEALVKLLWWMTHDAQKMAPELLYAPLPPEVVKLVEGKLKSITYQGQPLLQ